MTRSVYIIGSLRNPHIRSIGEGLRIRGWDVFDDWHAAGADADSIWQEYETASRGHDYREALAGYHGQHAFALDKKHLDRCSVGLLVLPAGKSGHLELGYMLGQGKPGYILMNGEPERFDLMYSLATAIYLSPEEMFEAFK